MRLLLTTTLFVTLALSASAQDKQAGSITDVTGVWIMLIEGHQVGLELRQKDTVVEGEMLAMGQRQLLAGTYIDRTLTLKGEKGPDGSGGPHGSPDAGPITAKMLDDGTLEGEISIRSGRVKWTGERLKKK